MVALMATALVFALIGFALSGGGGYLALLGGSVYYVLAGLGFLATAVLLAFRRPVALSIYGLIILMSLAWSVWEVGFDWWQLAPRCGLIVLFGLWLVTPSIRHPLGFQSPSGPYYRAKSWPVALPVFFALVIAVFAMLQNPHDLAGELPEQRVVYAPDLGGTVPAADWHHYGRTPYGQRYSPLAQINLSNVASLKELWRFQTGDLPRGGEKGPSFQATPIKVDNALYFCTAHNSAVALDATTGRRKWRYEATPSDAAARRSQPCRGVAYFADARMKNGGFCSARIYLPTADARLVALDAASGLPCTSFGERGMLNLEAGMPYGRAGSYQLTSPPVIVGDRIILGGAITDTTSIHQPSGVISAFDVRSGALLWNWDAGKPYQTAPLAEDQRYMSGSPNSWSVFSVDEKLGMVFVPMGNQVPHHLGTGRSLFVEKYASSIVALDVATGKDLWVRQTVHHDLWEMDVPAQPVLVDITRFDGESIPALVGATRQGDVYVLDRRTGEAIIPVREVPAPQGAAPGEFTSFSQPSSDLSFSPRPLEERDMWGLTLFDQLACRIRFKSLKYDGRYTPPSLQGSLTYPGHWGVFNWGSIAVDPQRQVLFSMPSYLASVARLVPSADLPPRGQALDEGSLTLHRNEGAAYGVYTGPFLGPLNIPCQAPPWGYVSAADLRTGRIAYKHVNGSAYDATVLPLPFELGMPGLGGPIITGSGIAFLAASLDNYIRAYELRSGLKVWEARLPAGGQSTPMTYLDDEGRQIVLIAAGGDVALGTSPGDFVIAYALTED